MDMGWDLGQVVDMSSQGLVMYNKIRIWLVSPAPGSAALTWGRRFKYTVCLPQIP